MEHNHHAHEEINSLVQSAGDTSHGFIAWLLDFIPKSTQTDRSLSEVFANLMPHNHCFLWAKELVPFWFSANMFIFTSYLVIASSLTIVFVKRKEMQHIWISLIYALFIVMCGIGHLIMALNIFEGAYILETYWHIATAIISVAAMLVTLRLVPVLINAPKLDHLSEALKLAEKVRRELEALKK